MEIRSWETYEEYRSRTEIEHPKEMKILRKALKKLKQERRDHVPKNK